ncbi:MAG: hypothetical protein QME21_00515 [Anaerolineales bacterium]|nr:hypothetical protein [Anaerolineales bacterium]
MDDKITIIEGPTPTFEAVSDGWALGLNEGPYLFNIALTRLRTFNGSALIERCNRAWRNQNSINLEYRDMDGLESRAPILAARAIDVDEGQVLILWVRLEYDEDELEAGLEDPGDDFYDDLDDDPNR